ncbi:MAG TPA: hypothetical protein V6D21_18855, partial [Candidatus Obscuribacterales bacterium]
MTLTTYNTTFTEHNGESKESIDLKIEYGADFTGDELDDIRITLALNPASQSGTEDIVGFAFDIQNDAVSDLKIVEPITTALVPGATSSLSPTTPLTGIAANNVGDGYFYDFDLSTNGLNALPPYDVGIQLNKGGLGDGQVQSTTFVLTSLSGTNSLDAEQLLENTDWWIRLQSTSPPSGSSAKTGGKLGDIPTPGTFTPLININKVTNGVDDLEVLAGSEITWSYTVTNSGNVPLSNVSLIDDQEGAISNFIGGDTNNDGQLDLSETWVYEATGNAGVGDYNNIGTVAGDYNGTTVTDQDPSNYFGANPLININKVTNGVDDLEVLAGSEITWSYTVTNSGNVPLSNVSL